MAIQAQITTAAYIDPARAPHRICATHISLVNGGVHDISDAVSKLARDHLRIARDGDRIDFEVFRDRIEIRNTTTGTNTTFTKDARSGHWGSSAAAAAAGPALNDALLDALTSEIINKVHSAYQQCLQGHGGGHAAPGSPHGAGGTGGVNIVNNYGMGMSGQGLGIPDTSMLERQIAQLRETLATCRGRLADHHGVDSEGVQARIVGLEARLAEKEDALAALRRRPGAGIGVGGDDAPLRALQEQQQAIRAELARIARELEALRGAAAPE